MDADLSADLIVLNSVKSGLSRAAAEPTSIPQQRTARRRGKSPRPR